MKKTWGNLLAGLMAAVLLTSLFVAGCTVPEEESDQTRNATPSPTPAANISAEAVKGRIVVTATSAAADLQDITGIAVTVQNISIHNASQGWSDLSAPAATLNLVQMQNESAETVLVDAYADIGSYDRIRLILANPVVTDAAGEHNATLPSTEYAADANLTVAMESAAVATFDFIANESLHVTDQGDYVFAPVANVTARNDAMVVSMGGNQVITSGGDVATQAKVGMDADGNVGPGMGIPANATLTVESGKVRIASGS